MTVNLDLFFLIRALARAGAETQMVHLATGLAGRGHRVRIGVFYPSGDFAQELTEAGVTVVNLNKGGRWDLPGFFMRLARLLMDDPPSVLHGYLGTANIFSSLLKPLLPKTKIVWSMRSSNLDLTPYGRAAQFSWGVERRLARFADLIIANSEAGKRYGVSQGFPAAKTTVINNGIDCERFRPNKEAGAAMRAAWGIGQEETVIGLVGRTDPVKGHEQFIRAAALLHKEREHIRFVCIGADPYGRLDGLHALAREAGVESRLLFTGQQENMPGAYSALDMLCQASSSEGFPNVLAEAMACGVPCVATDVGDSKAIVGDAGIVVQAGDTAALHKGMLSLLNTPNDLNPRSQVTSQFSLAAMVEKTEAALTALCSA